MSCATRASFSGVSLVLARLGGTLESADGAPSIDDRRAVEVDSGLAEKVLASWNALKTGDLPRFNERLRRAGLEAIALP